MNKIDFEKLTVSEKMEICLKIGNHIFQELIKTFEPMTPCRLDIIFNSLVTVISAFCVSFVKEDKVEYSLQKFSKAVLAEVLVNSERIKNEEQEKS